MNPANLSGYLSDAIFSLRKNALRVSLRHPGALLYFWRMRKRLKKAAEKRAGSAAEGFNIPPFLIASITKQCNLACKGCYARANGGCGTGTDDLLSTERWTEIFAEAEELGVSFILLAGGEPMLRADVLEAAARREDLIFPVFTNGTISGEKTMRLFTVHRNLLPILSLEGDAHETDTRRGEGVYRKVTDTMRMLKKKGIFYGVSVTVTKENLEEVTSPEFIGSLCKNGCSLVFYVEYVPADGVSDGLAPGDKERKALEERVSALRSRSHMMFISFPGDEKVTGGCLAAGRGFFHINAAGGAEPCPFSPYSDLSLRDHSLREALSSPLFCRMQENDFLLGEHDGGCLLWQKREEVENLVQNGRD